MGVKLKAVIEWKLLLFCCIGQIVDIRINVCVFHINRVLCFIEIVSVGTWASKSARASVRENIRSAPAFSRVAEGGERTC